MLISGMIANSDIISFDIFDTLLTRIVDDPHDVFILAGQNCTSVVGDDPVKFAKAREKAAKQAMSRAGRNGECTLKDIYDEMIEYSESDRIALMNNEMETEAAVLRQNINVKSIYDLCISFGKTVIAVSDMYLPSNFLMKVLRNCGYTHISKIYVSCEHNLSKRNGDLFKLIERELGKVTFLHFGDSWKSDCLNPLKMGWRVWHIKKPRPSGTPLKETISKKAIETYKDSYFAMNGYSTLGPILFEFCKWLYNDFTNRDITSILFFSRDGKIIEEAFRILYPNLDKRIGYFHVSRKTLNVASLWMHPDFESLRNYIVETYTFSMRTFLRRIGVDDIRILNEIEQQIDLDIEYQAEEFWLSESIKSIYNSLIKSYAVENSLKQYSCFKDYFKMFVESGDVGIVDIGWRGSMQDRLEQFEELLDIVKVRSIHGYYLGIESNSPMKHGYLYEGGDQSASKTVIDAGVGLFETLFLAHEGTTLGYREENGNIIPILEEYEISDAKMISDLDEIHRGAIDYVLDMREFDIMYKDIDVNLNSFKQFKLLCLYPRETDLSHFERIIFNDTVEVPLIETKGVRYYIKHPNRFKGDYHNAPWKIGFLKRNVSKYINWGILYNIIKNL